MIQPDAELRRLRNQLIPVSAAVLRVKTLTQKQGRKQRADVRQADYFLSSSYFSLLLQQHLTSGTERSAMCGKRFVMLFGEKEWKWQRRCAFLSSSLSVYRSKLKYLSPKEDLCHTSFSLPHRHHHAALLPFMQSLLLSPLSLYINRACGHNTASSCLFVATSSGMRRIEVLQKEDKLISKLINAIEMLSSSLVYWRFAYRASAISSDFPSLSFLLSL